MNRILTAVALLSMAFGVAPTLISTLRGLADSATGTVTVSTPWS